MPSSSLLSSFPIPTFPFPLEFPFSLPLLWPLLLSLSPPSLSFYPLPPPSIPSPTLPPPPPPSTPSPPPPSLYPQDIITHKLKLEVMRFGQQQRGICQGCNAARTRTTAKKINTVHVCACMFRLSCSCHTTGYFHMLKCSFL